ncbi:MAG: putative metal-binding protein [Rhodoferax sp.]
MELPLTTEILVCVLCRPAGASREAPRAGLALFEAVQEATLRAELPFAVRPIECLNACERSCTVVLQAAGKTSYLFGGLLPEDACASDVVACAQLHEASADGIMARDRRPGRLREGILARIPAPLGHT